jgi:hypothetical protein
MASSGSINTTRRFDDAGEKSCDSAMNPIGFRSGT